MPKVGSKLISMAPELSQEFHDVFLSMHRARHLNRHLFISVYSTEWCTVYYIDFLSLHRRTLQQDPAVLAGICIVTIFFNIFISNKCKIDLSKKINVTHYCS